MISLSLRNATLTLTFVATLFLGGFALANAQSCTTNAQCGTGKLCVGVEPGKAGVCRATDNGPANTPTGGATNNQGGTLVNPLKADSIEELLALVVAAAVRIGTIILVLMLVWVGFLFVAARGNEEKLRTARTAFFWTVIGGLILLGATAISQVIQSTASSLGS